MGRISSMERISGMGRISGIRRIDASDSSGKISWGVHENHWY